LEAKYYTFDLKFGSEGPGVSLDASTTRRLAEILGALDWDAPSESDVFADGVSDFHWRIPPPEKRLVEALKTLKLDFRYRFVPDGRNHKVKGCERCDEEGPYQYGGFCSPLITDEDWKTCLHSTRS
jgi:hypothetical protein